MRIAIIGQKGGCGKTTVAVNLACGLTEKGYSVLIVDADPQASAMRWRAASATEDKLPTVISIPKPILHHPDQVPRLAAAYEFTIIDCPPALGDVTRSALQMAHLAILPVSPSPFDVWSAADALGLVQQVRITNPGLQVRLLITRKIPNTVIGREAREALATYQQPIFRTEVGQRVVLTEAIMVGKGVHHYAPDSTAAEEFQSLTKEVLTIYAKTSKP